MRQFCAAVSIDRDPLIQCEGNVVGKHAEAVDHLTRDRFRLVALPDHAGRFPGLLDEAVHQLFVHGIVDVAVEHVGVEDVLLVAAVLAIVAEHRVVAEDDLPLVVPDLRVLPDPDKPGAVKAFVIEEIVVVSQDQVQFAVQLFQDVGGAYTVAGGEGN